MDILEPENEINALCHQLARQMSGYNYGPTFGVIKVARAQSLADIQQEIKTQYKDTKPNDASYKQIDNDGMFMQIQECFDYRGYDGAGLELTPEQESALKVAQQEFINYIHAFIDDNTVIYSTDLEEGLPLYHTFWHFAFIVLNPKSESLFLFGAASD